MSTAIASWLKSFPHCFAMAIKFSRLPVAKPFKIFFVHNGNSMATTYKTFEEIKEPKLRHTINF
jgi:hypothetical protein